MYSDLFIFSWNLANIFKTLQKNEKIYLLVRPSTNPRRPMAKRHLRRSDVGDTQGELRR